MSPITCPRPSRMLPRDRKRRTTTIRNPIGIPTAPGAQRRNIVTAIGKPGHQSAWWMCSSATWRTPAQPSRAKNAEIASVIAVPELDQKDPLSMPP